MKLKVSNFGLKCEPFAWSREASEGIAGSPAAGDRDGRRVSLTRRL